MFTLLIRKLNCFWSLTFVCLLLSGVHGWAQVFVSTGGMGTPRSGHTAQRLPDGRVLVTGGMSASSPQTAELYDPATGTWSYTGAPSKARFRPASVVLADGTVLVVGGFLSSSTSAAQRNAEIYNPVTQKWSMTGSPNVGEGGQTLTLLPDGRALLIGGSSLVSTKGEIYNPATGLWTQTSTLLHARNALSGALLADGRVLISGGAAQANAVLESEIYDPATGSFVGAGSQLGERISGGAAPLPGGEVLIAGGLTGLGTSFNSLATAEIYNPALGAWRQTGKLSSRRSGMTLTKLADGRVLACGGFAWVGNGGTFVSQAEIYDAATASWTAAGALGLQREDHTATLLSNGEVLIAGGAEGNKNTGSAEIFNPAGPVLTVVSLVSDHAGAPELAWRGDQVTLTFTASESIGSPTVTLLGQSVPVTALPNNTWTASMTVPATGPHGLATFAISYLDGAGRLVNPVSSTTDGSAVTVDVVTQPPTTTTIGRPIAHSMSVAFNLPEQPRPGSVKLRFSDVLTGASITWVLGPEQEVTGERILTCDPQNPTANPQIVSGQKLVSRWYEMILSISYQDAAGNPSANVPIRGFKVDLEPPVMETVAMSARFVRPGSSVTVGLKANEKLSNITGTIAGLPVRGFAAPDIGNPYASVTLPEDAPEGPLSFSIVATDEAGNSTGPITSPSAGLAFCIVDGTPPQITVPAPLVVEATGPKGVFVTFTTTCIDNFDQLCQAQCIPPSGSVFKIGRTFVAVSARDAAGNLATESFTVDVVDTTKPVASAPSELRLPVGLERRVALGDLTASVSSSDLVGVTSVTQTPGASTTLPPGTYPVSFVVSDAAGNAVTLQSSVVVFVQRPSLAPVVTIGARSGQPAPAGPPEGTLLSTFSTPAVSDNRERITRVGLIRNRTRSAAILVEDAANGQRLAAWQGGPVSGTSLPGVMFRSFQDPVIAPGGSFVFAGTMQGPGIKTGADQALWTNAFTVSPEMLEMTLREGGEVPGLGGARLKTVSSISLRDGALLALVTLLPAPQLVNATNDTALLLLTAVNEGQLLLREGKPLGNDPAAIVQRFGVLQPAGKSEGQGRWQADGAILAKVTLRGGEVRLVKIGHDGTVTSLLSTANPAAAVAPVARWKGFTIPALSPAGGAITVAATLRPVAQVSTLRDAAVLLTSAGDGAWSLFARQGAAISEVPGAPAYGVFFDPVVNDAGHVAFLATLQRKGLKGANAQGLFAGKPDGESLLLAQLGGPAPDDFGHLHTAKWSKFLSCALPSGSGAGVIFLAETTGNEAPASRRQGLWAVDSQGTLRRLLRTADPVTPGGPALSRLSLLGATPGAFGTSRSYNATGSIALQATFADQTQAVLCIDVP